VKKLPKCTHSGTLEIGDIKINCAVLDNGKRVMNTSNVLKAFGRKQMGISKIGDESHQLLPKNLRPYMTGATIRRIIQPHEYLSRTGRPTSGFDAEIIHLLCEAYLRAREDGSLLLNQRHLAEKSEIIIRSFARTGIVALVDEATGFQYDREKQALQKILAKYIREEYLKWQERFPKKFYKEIYRLYGWKYDPKNGKRTPYLGRFTNKYVYEQMPPGVLEALRKKNPDRKVRHHQFLTDHTGVPHLDKHLMKLITIMELSGKIKDFNKNFEKIFGREANAA